MHHSTRPEKRQRETDVIQSINGYSADLVRF